MKIQAVQSTHVSKKNIIKRRAWLAVILLIFAVLQNTAGLFPQIFGARAFILIPLITAIAMYERDIPGMLYGLFAGALWDVVAGGGDLNAIFLVTVGFICGTLINTIMRNNFATHLLLTAFTVLIYVTCYWLYHFVFMGLDRAFLTYISFYIPSAVYTLVLSTPIFFIVMAIENHFRESEFTL